MRSTRFVIAAIAATFLLAISACSDDDPVAGDDDMADMADMDDTDDGHGDHEDFDFGEPADAADSDRVIELVAQDDFSYSPSSLTVAAGEKITFRVTNEGVIPHDFTLGRADLQDEHDIEMAEMGGMMMADEANGFMIEPGQTKELTWHFTETGEVLIGCHVAGHYAAGMKAEIQVEA